MKIFLIKPQWGNSFQISYPLSLGYLSSSLKKNGFNDIEFIDGSLLKLNPSEMIEKIRQVGFPGIIGIQVYTGSQNWTKEFITLSKKKYPDTAIIVGGPHITALKEVALSYIGASFGVIGEGEEAIVEFAKLISGEKINKDEIPGFIYWDGNKYSISKKDFGFLENINKIPFPDWELLQPNKYFKFMEGATLPLRGTKPVTILTSRGCPYNCTFCASRTIFQRKIRFRSPENVIEEIKFLIQKYGIDEIFFADDNLTMDINRAEKLFNLMIKEKLNIFWRAPNGIRIDRVNEQLIKKMAESGCYYVGVGVETGNPQIMNKIQKNLNLNIIKPAVSLLNKYKIKVSGFFMCGLLGETKQQIEDSVNFSLKVPFDRIQVSIFCPYPGSSDFEKIFSSKTKEQYLRKIERFQQNDISPVFGSLTEEEKIKIQRRFIWKFYFRPRIIWSVIKNMKIGQFNSVARHPFIINLFKNRISLYGKKIK